MLCASLSFHLYIYSCQFEMLWLLREFIVTKIIRNCQRNSGLKVFFSNWYSKLGCGYIFNLYKALQIMLYLGLWLSWQNVFPRKWRNERMRSFSREISSQKSCLKCWKQVVLTLRWAHGSGQIFFDFNCNLSIFLIELTIWIFV